MVSSKALTQFSNFILSARQFLHKMLAEDCDRFSTFIAEYRHIEQGQLQPIKVKFHDFLRNFRDLIRGEIEHWGYYEKVAYELFVIKKHNIFEYFNYQEGHYRDFLVWLLTPIASHRIGSKFAELFINRVARICGDNHENHGALPRESFHELKVHREAFSIDFLIVGTDFHCAVEMKILSGLGKQQLSKYSLSLKKDPYYSSKRRQFKLYLDPKVNPQKYHENLHKLLHSGDFKMMDWWEVVLLVSELYHSLIESPIKYVVGQFIVQMLTILSGDINVFYDRTILLDKIWQYDLIASKGGKIGKSNF